MWAIRSIVVKGAIDEMEENSNVERVKVPYEGNNDSIDHGSAKKARVDDTAPFSCEESPIFDSDSEPTEPSSLNWRNSAVASFSDWTIEILGDANTPSCSYNVHRAVLILGSKYFRDTFVEDVNRIKTTQLKLPELAAEAFPHLLDYAYHPGKLVLTTENASVMYFFGQRFGMNHLCWKAKQFWKGDLTYDTVPKYYDEAILLGSKCIMDAVKQACCRDEILLRFNADSAILNIADPELWLFLLEHVDPVHCVLLSKLVATFCLKHDIRKELFDLLTDPGTMPVVHSSASWMLLNKEQELWHDSGASNTLSSLQQRCTMAIESKWQEIDMSNEQVRICLQNPNPFFLGALFQCVVARAQKDSSPNQTPLQDHLAEDEASVGEHSVCDDDKASEQGQEDENRQKELCSCEYGLVSPWPRTEL